MTTSTLSARGQVVIPAQFRRWAKLQSGDQLSFRYDTADDALIIKKTEDMDEALKRFASYVKPGYNSHESDREFYERERAKDFS